MASYTSFGDWLKATANAIKDKKGTTDKIKPINFPEEIASIEAGGGSSGIDSWVAGETTEIVYNGETIKHGTFSRIDSNATSYQNQITKFSGPNVKTIEPYAFYKRTELTEVNLPNLEECGSAFMYCSGLKTVNFPKLTKFTSATFSQNSGIVNVIAPNVTYLGNQCFDSCTNLVMSELPKNITYIGQACFSGCSKVTFSEVPEGVTEINGSAFYGCTGLTKMVIPAGVTKINGRMFGNCTNLKEVTFKSKPNTMFTNVFYNCTQTDLVINVPWAEGAVDGAPWGATNATINYNYTG